MRIDVTACVIAGALVLTSLAVAAQQPPQPPQSPRPTSSPRPTARGSEGVVTLEGCLAREADIEGRLPKIPESNGVTGDFVLTRAKVIKGTAPVSLTGAYDVDDIDAGLLESFVGQRVQIDGWFDELDRAANPTGRGRAHDDLVEIRGNAVRAIAKDCDSN
jgi:hypothetical protein